MLKQAGWHPNIVALIGACTQKGMSVYHSALSVNTDLRGFNFHFFINLLFF